MGLTNLKEIFNDKYYQNLSGGTLQAMGVLFSNDLRMYTYPSQPDPAAQFNRSTSTSAAPALLIIFEQSPDR